MLTREKAAPIKTIRKTIQIAPIISWLLAPSTRAAEITNRMNAMRATRPTSDSLTFGIIMLCKLFLNRTSNCIAIIINYFCFLIFILYVIFSQMSSIFNQLYIKSWFNPSKSLYTQQRIYTNLSHEQKILQNSFHLWRSPVKSQESMR